MLKVPKLLQNLSIQILRGLLGKINFYYFIAIIDQQKYMYFDVTVMQHLKI